MKTDDLIRTLAADEKSRLRVGNFLTVTLLAAAPLSVIGFFVMLGVRLDIGTAIYNPFFELKFAVTISLAICAIVLSLQLSRPEAVMGGGLFVLLVPVGLLVAGIVSDLMISKGLGWTARLVGSNSWICLTAIPLLALPLLGAALVALRHGATSRPAVAGALAGLLSAGLAATLYASHCTDDSPLFVATWYTIAIALITAIGALVGSRVLRY